MKTTQTAGQTANVELTRIKNDFCGNPRYVCHFLDLVNDGDRAKANATNGDIFGIETLYSIALNKARKMGGRKFHNKQYGGGLVFQSYNTSGLIDAINEAKAGNTDFLKDWTDFRKQERKVEKAILNHLKTHTYKVITNHSQPAQKLLIGSYENGAKVLYDFEGIDSLLGFAYTSTGTYAAMWICNGVYLMANDTHHFIGFAINTAGEVVGIAEDEDENAIYITL